MSLRRDILLLFSFLHQFRFIRRLPLLAFPPLLTFLLLQYPNFPASTTSCMHLVSISKFHPPRAIVSNKNHKQDNVSQFVGNLCELEGPRCLNRSTLGWGTLRVGLYRRKRNRPCVSWELLKVLWLRDKCRCEGTYCYCFLSCINFVSYVDFPYWPLRHFLRFCCCNIRTSRHQQLLACILSQYLNSTHPVP